MKKTALIFFVIAFAGLALGGCSEKDPAFDREWIGNPKKIILNKPGESLTDVSKRLLGQPLDSFGLFDISDADAVYVESLPLYITADAPKMGQKIYSVSELCGYQKAIPVGDLFGELDCKSGTVNKLQELSNNKSSGILELCEPVNSDPDQKTAGYADLAKGISWELAVQVVDGKFQNVIHSIKIFTKLPSTGRIRGLHACDLRARADANQWYKPAAFVGNIIGGCNIDEKGPGKFIETLEFLHQPCQRAWGHHPSGVR